MEIETYLDIIKVFEIKEENPSVNTIFKPLIDDKKLDAVSFVLNTKSNFLKKHIQYIDILQNINDDINFAVNNYNIKYKEYFPVLILDNIILNIPKDKDMKLRCYTLNTLNKLEFKHYNKNQIYNNTGLKIKNGNIF